MDYGQNAISVIDTQPLLKEPTLTLVTSDTIGKIAAALAKAQASIESAQKNSNNPHFDKTYASLDAVLEAALPLSANEIAITQVPGFVDGKHVLISLLIHSSGEWIKAVCPLIYSKNDMQGYGSALTYARRYSASAMAGIAQADDDGNLAKEKGSVKQEPRQQQARPARAPTVTVKVGDKTITNGVVGASGPASKGGEENAWRVGKAEIDALNFAEKNFSNQGWDNLNIKKYITARYDTTVHKLSKEDFAALLKTIELTAAVEAFKEIPVK